MVWSYVQSRVLDRMKYCCHLRGPRILGSCEKLGFFPAGRELTSRIHEACDLSVACYTSVLRCIDVWAVHRLPGALITPCSVCAHSPCFPFWPANQLYEMDIAEASKLVGNEAFRRRVSGLPLPLPPAAAAAAAGAACPVTRSCRL